MKGAGLFSRWPRWPVTLTVVGVIIAGGAAAVGKWPHAWWWLIVVIVAAAAVIPPALAALSQAAQRRQEIARVARAGLQGTTGPGGSRLPAANSADLEARVHQTVLRVPYIQRDEEDTIHAHLRARHPVLLIGPSMVGKTKMAAHVIADEFGSWPVAIPDSKTALADLETHDVALQGTVIWLDDIDRLIGADGITDGAVRRLSAAGNIIIGTIRARAYDRLRPSDELHPPEWDVLCVFERIFVSRDLTAREQEQLANAVSDPDIRDRIKAVGLGEYVGAAGQVAEALKLGAAGADSLGYALTLAAADWRRCGMIRPVPASMLVLLAEPHLDQRGRIRLADQEAVQKGMMWATQDINPNVSLLQPAGADCYSIYDYALDLISAQDVPIPDGSWDAIIDSVDSPELVRIGFTAESVYHRSDAAIRAWRKAGSTGQGRPAAVASYALGSVLAREGDKRGAKDAYQKAIDSGHASAASMARLDLGNLLAREGDVQGAKDAYQIAIASSHAEAAPKAEFNMGILLAKEGNLQGAMDAYRRVVASGRAEIAPVAAFNLGIALAEQGDVPGAKDAYRKAINSEHIDAAPGAALNLGKLLSEEGDVQGAIAAYRKAIEKGNSESAPKAAFNLGRLLAGREDTQGAMDAFRKAIASGQIDAAPKAAFNLGDLLAKEGDVPGAKDAYQKAIDSGHATMAPLAMLNLGILLLREGNAQGAKDAFQGVIASGDTDQAPSAAYNLGGLLAKEGDVHGAKDAYQKAIDSGDARVASRAALRLKALIGEHGQADRPEFPARE
jgi:tetratricopeptide (TPR) repeat protein